MSWLKDTFELIFTTIVAIVFICAGLAGMVALGILAVIGLVAGVIGTIIYIAFEEWRDKDVQQDTLITVEYKQVAGESECRLQRTDSNSKAG